MKKEYIICFVTKGFGGVKSIIPFGEKRFSSPEAAEPSIEHLLKDTSSVQEYFLLPCYSKKTE